MPTLTPPLAPSIRVYRQIPPTWKKERELSAILTPEYQYQANCDKIEIAPWPLPQIHNHKLNILSLHSYVPRGSPLPLTSQPPTASKTRLQPPKSRTKEGAQEFTLELKARCPALRPSTSQTPKPLKLYSQCSPAEPLDLLWHHAKTCSLVGCPYSGVYYCQPPVHLEGTSETSYVLMTERTKSDPT